MREALALALAGPYTTQIGRTYANLQTCLVDHLSLRRGRASATARASPTARSTTSTPSPSTSLEARQVVLVHTGRWAEAEAIVEGPLASDVPSPFNRVAFLLALGESRARRGLPGVWEPLDEATPSASPSASRGRVVLRAVARAEAHWLAGDQEGAVRDLDEARRGGRTRRQQVPSSTPCHR